MSLSTKSQAARHGAVRSRGGQVILAFRQGRWEEPLSTLRRGRRNTSASVYNALHTGSGLIMPEATGNDLPR